MVLTVAVIFNESYIASEEKKSSHAAQDELEMSSTANKSSYGLKVVHHKEAADGKGSWLQAGSWQYPAMARLL